MTDQLLYSKEGAIAVIRFNRPEKKNALTGAMYTAMGDALADAAADDAIRALAIFGGEVFTAGNDIGDFLAVRATSEELPPLRFLRKLIGFPKPVLAGVKGNAIGIGTTLLMHCDGVVAGTSAKFAMPFTKLALVPEAASSLMFPLIAGRSRATWYLLSGEAFSANDALDMGLVTRVTGDAEVEGMVLAMCATLAELPPKSVANTKRLIKLSVADAVKCAFDLEIEAFAEAVQSDEARSVFMKFMTRT